MKQKYTTPVITTEELLKQDVLLASNEIDPNVKDDANLGADLFTYIWNGSLD